MIDHATAFAERVGRGLRALREEKRLKQDELAARIVLPDKTVSPKTVSSWETGRTPLPLPMLEPLAQALRVNPGYLGQRLGLCGSPSSREIRVAECADIMSQLDGEPPEIVDDVLFMLRKSVDLVKSRRLARTN